MNQFEMGLSRYLSQEKLERLWRVKVGIFGAGGLGSNCAAMLVRTGIRRLKIVDHDLVDASNLNRQFFFLGQVGRPKVSALRDNLQDINPDALIEVWAGRATEENAASLFADCDVIVEALDDAGAKKMIVETYLPTGKLIVAASGIAGFGDSDRIRTRKINATLYLVGDESTAVGPDCPPLAPCVTIAAAKMADVVVERVLQSMPEAS